MTESAEETTIAPPLTDLPIDTVDGGFYDGFAKSVAIPAKAIVTAFIIWAIAFPSAASETLGAANKSIIANFAGWYIYVVALFLVACLVIAIVPKYGSMVIGRPDEKPEFGRFSWFAMLFGAGLGIGMLTYSTGEPLSHFSNNPEIIGGAVAARSAEAVESAYRYSFLHWGLSAWAIYAIVGLSVGYVSYRRGLPLTIRSGLAPLLGRSLSGWAGHLVDVVAVVATVLGISVTLSFGVNQFVAGMDTVFGWGWLLDGEGQSTPIAIVAMLVIIVGLSTLSALSGVGKGIKWLSNLNLGLTFILLATFLVAGSAMFGLQIFGSGMVDYLANLPRLSLTLLSFDGSEVSDAAAQWQLDWTVFYWAWWLAFAPFVGMFIARISRGRTVREYILGVVLAPSLMCFVWFVFVGGTAIDLELSGLAGGVIVDAPLSQQLYRTLEVMLSPAMASMYSFLVLVLLLTYVVTSADSAILIVNTINAAGGGDEDERHHHSHIIFWGVAIALIVGSLLIIGGIDAISTAMVLGALPFSVVAVLMVVAVVKAIVFDTIRDKQGVTSYKEDEVS